MTNKTPNDPKCSCQNYHSFSSFNFHISASIKSSLVPSP